MAESSDHLCVEELVRQFKASRETFEKAFDTFVDTKPDERVRFKALALRRNRREPLEPGAERDKADFHLALEYAKAQGFLADLCAVAGATLFTAAPVGKDGLVMAVALTEGEQARNDAQIAFEAIVRKNERLRDPDEVNAGLMRAQRCTCRVVVMESGTRVRGTGFLIGPRLVLTNWHVLQSLLERLPEAEAAEARLAPAEAWRAKEGSAAALSVEFDFTARAAQAGGTTRIPASPDWFVAASSAQGQEYRRNEREDMPWPDDVADFEPYDDFAVFEIAESAGLDRRFYDIVGEEPPLPSGDMVLFHHPGDYSMRLSYGSFDVEASFAKLLGGNPLKTSARVLHNANSIGGSSGGPCLNFDMRPVALHQAGIEFKGEADINDEQGRPLPKSVMNIAIPLHRVRTKAGAAIQARMGGLRALKSVLSNGDPLIGRAELQEAIADARNGKFKILIVRSDMDGDGKPYAKVGKSFSKRILDENLDPTRHEVVQLSAKDLFVDAARSAGAILAAVNGTQAVSQPSLAGTANSEDRQSTEIVEIVPRLAVRLTEELVSAAGRRTLWIVIDDLDKPSLIDSSTRALLDLLYAGVAAAPALRLVLVGLGDVDLPGLRGIKAKCFEKPLTPLDDDKVARWVGHRLDGRFALPDAARECIAGLVMELARSRKSNGSSITEAVAATVKKDLDPFFKKRMGL